MDGLWTAQRDAPPTNPPTAPAGRPQGPQATTAGNHQKPKSKGKEAGKPKPTCQRDGMSVTAPPPPLVQGGPGKRKSGPAPPAGAAI